MTTDRALRRLLGAALALACALSLSVALMTPAEAAYRFKAPKSLRATAATSSTMTLRWAAVRGAKAYQVAYAGASSMKGAKYVRTAKVTTTLRSLRPSTRYYFRVRVVNARTHAAMSSFTARAYPSSRTSAAPVVATPPPAGPVAWPSTTPAPLPGDGNEASLRVASFNLFGVNNDSSASGEQTTWRTRRPVVVSQIMAERPAVVGLQEASQSNIYASQLTYGTTQYDDLAGALQAAGGHYAVTNRTPYNCAKPTSSTDCVATYRGASNSSRIIYDTDQADLVAQGSMKYTSQAAGKIDRYLAWAVVRLKANGSEVFFADTHLDSYDIGVRVAQWHELITRVNQLKNGRPVVVVGDFNTTKYSSWAREMLPRMVSEGYGDVLAQQYDTPTATPRAQVVENGWISSSNHFDRDVTKFSWDDHRRIGNNIDWVFASNALTVEDWKTVVDYDSGTDRVTGVIPSDHCMVRATLLVP